MVEYLFELNSLSFFKKVTSFDLIVYFDSIFAFVSPVVTNLSISL